MNLGKAFCLAGAATIAFVGAGPAAAQQQADRVDPALLEKQAGAPVPGLPGDGATSPQAPLRAAPPGDANAVFDGAIPVGAVVIDGARTFRAAQFAAVIEPYLGRSLIPDELKALAKGVADFARAGVYVFASAYVPKQSVANGVLHVRLDEGRIDEVRVTGAPNPAIDRALRGLADGRPVTRREVERALLLAGDLPGVDIAGSAYRREGDRGVLVVESRSERIIGNLQIDNRGSSAVGPVRLRMRADANGVFLRGDQLSVRGTLTPVHLRELATIGFDYAADTGANGMLAGVGASYTRVQPGGRTRSFEIDGRSASVNANLSYPVLRSLDANAWVTADLTVRDVEQDRAGAAVREDRLTTLTLGASGYRGWLGGWIYARVSARQGLNILDATKRGDPLASRRGAGSIFSKLDLYADWTGSLAGPLSMRVAAEGQISTRALLSSEEMGLGGPRFGRAYDYSERSGDRGVAGAVELRYDLKGLLVKGRTTQLYAFADAGTVGNLGGGGRGGDLYSAGAGARFDLSRMFDAGIEAGLPIGRDRFETGDRNPRISVTLTARF